MLRVIYLVFNEGYSASSGTSLTRHDLSAEAIRLGRLLVDLLPEPEAIGLLALMLLHESRRAARDAMNGRGRPARANRTARCGTAIRSPRAAARGAALVTQRFGPYTIQAAIAAVHAEAPSAEETDWEEIVGLYGLLLRAGLHPCRAEGGASLTRDRAEFGGFFVAMKDGPGAGLGLIDAILRRGDLVNYRLAHAARADMCRRLGRTADARAVRLRTGPRAHEAGPGTAIPRAAAG